MPQRREGELEASDPFGALLLGGISLMDRLDLFLESEAAETAPVPELPPEERVFLDALLGVVALRNTLRGHVDALPPDAPASAQSASLLAVPALLR